MIETSGVIEKEQGNGFYLVTLEQPEGHQCLCRAAGKLTKFRIKLLKKHWQGVKQRSEFKAAIENII